MEISSPTTAPPVSISLFQVNPKARRLTVVVAALITVYIAVRHADPVLPRPAPAVRVDPATLQQLSPEERAAAELSVMPAGKARNHVMSPNPPREP